MMRPLVLLLAASTAALSSNDIVLDAINYKHLGRVTLWCSPDNAQTTIKSATIIRKKDNEKFKPTITSNNATLLIEKVTVDDGGEYICNLNTSNGPHNYTTTINIRPVINTDEYFTYDKQEKTTRKAQIQTKAFGSDVNLTCPVDGFPAVNVFWYKKGEKEAKEPLDMGKVQLDGSTIILTNLTYNDTGVYGCRAINEYSQEGIKKTALIIIERELRVRSKYAWIYPLIAIIIILILNFVIIIFCEMRKKRMDRKTLYVAQE